MPSPQLPVSKPSKMDSQKLKQILISEAYAAEKDLLAAEKAAADQHLPLEEYLVAAGVLSADLLGQAMAEYFKVPYADLNSFQPSAEQVLKIPEETARKLRVVLFKDEAKKAVVATDNPQQKELAAALKKIFKSKKVELQYSVPDDIDHALLSYRHKLSARLQDIMAKSERAAPEVLEAIFEDALLLHASDIHFEPQDKIVQVRFRIDGVLQPAGEVPKNLYENMINRIKVLAHLRLDEHFAAQDGAVRYPHGGRSIDMRVSIIPTIDGEKVVMRLLAAYVRGLTLVDLGLSSTDQAMLLASSKKPFGMILVVGPTGSGKTTTLYGLLKLLNRPGVNITTIEDPVEYKISGVNHIQVNNQTNLTFSQGLRSIVRQDPDIILVGEIRDLETAEIAVNASLTGHLLLSTFHANDAATSLPRLLDMGVEPFLLASTMELVIAQRLVRKLCESCRYSVVKKPTELQRAVAHADVWFGKKAITLYAAKGCDACGHTGYKGRTAIFELIHVTPEMQELLLTHPSTPQIMALAKSQGTHSLFADGVEKVKAGVTTLEELLRVAQPDKDVVNVSS